MVVKIELKKLLGFFFVQYMPHGNCSTAFVSQDIYTLLTIHSSMDLGQQLLHKIFITQSFDLKMTYFCHWHLR